MRQKETKFQVGDELRVVGRRGTDELHYAKDMDSHIGRTFKVERISGSYLSAFGWSWADDWLELTDSTKLKSPMTPTSLKSKFLLSLKSEPEKTFIKAGILDSTGNNFTTEGKATFEAWLWEKNKETFKKEVVDPILAEDAKS